MTRNRRSRAKRTPLVPIAGPSHIQINLPIRQQTPGPAFSRLTSASCEGQTRSSRKKARRLKKKERDEQREPARKQERERQEQKQQEERAKRQREEEKRQQESERERQRLAQQRREEEERRAERARDKKEGEEKQRQRDEEKRQALLARQNEDLEFIITTVEALLLTKKNPKDKTTLNEYRYSYRYKGDDQKLRNQKLSQHAESVMSLLLRKLPVPLNQIPPKILKQFPKYSKPILQDLDEKIRKEIKQTYNFITELGEQEFRERKRDSRLRHTRLLCSAMDAHVAEIKTLSTLPNSLQVCLELMLFVMEKSYVAQEAGDLEEMEESGVDFNFGSQAADRLLTKLCYDSSERNDEGVLMLDIDGVLQKLLMAVDKCGSSRFFKKSIEQLETMRWTLRVELGDPGDSGYGSEEDFGDIQVNVPMAYAEYGDDATWYANSEPDSDGSTMAGVEYVIPDDEMDLQY